MWAGAGLSVPGELTQPEAGSGISAGQPEAPLLAASMWKLLLLCRWTLCRSNSSQLECELSGGFLAA